MLLSASRRWTGAALLAGLVLLAGNLLLAGAAVAQSAQGDPHDLAFTVTNATTGQPGTVDRLTIEYSTHVLNPVIDVNPQGSDFTIPAVPIKEIGTYIITAWADEVPYYWQMRGKNMLAEPVVLHVFDTSTDRGDLAITGLDLVLRKSESLVQLEYNMRVENSARPQVTVVGDPVLELFVPAGATDFQATHTRGPGPTPVSVQTLPGGRAGLSLPLTTGSNQIRLVCRLPWQDGLTVPVGANLPIQGWSLLAAPENLDIQAFELEPVTEGKVPGHLHFRGPALEAEREFTLRVGARVASGPQEKVFTTDAPAQRDEAQADAQENVGGGFPVAIYASIIVIIIIVVIARRRRR